MAESWRYTEEDAAEDPRVLVHKAKLAATTAEQAKRKTSGKAYPSYLSKEARKERLREKEADKDLKQLGSQAISILKAPFRLAKGQPIGRIKKPIHPDKTIKNRELYGFGGAAASRMTPLGRPMTDWRELYFGQKPVQKDSSEVLNALMHGANDIEEIKVYTGLDEQKIKGALRFLQQRGYDVKFVEE